MHPPVSQLRRHQQFHSEFLEHDRDVLVWLPPATRVLRTFDGRSTRVLRTAGTRSLYMHDGQNLFEPETAFQKGEHWRVGETATRADRGRPHRSADHRRHLQHRRDAHRRVHADRRHEARRRPGRRLRPDDHRGAEAAHRSHLSNAGPIATAPASPARRSAASCRCTWHSITRRCSATSPRSRHRCGGIARRS